jgi:uncharacterized membrane protein YkoI
MKHCASFLLTLCLLQSGSLFAADDAADVAGRLNDSKHSLLSGVARSEKQHGKAISAKFEMKGETLMLSVYTARGGLAQDAEHNELIELIGDASQAEWTPAIEVFADPEHLKRSAMQLTLVQSSRLSLSDAVKQAESGSGGRVFSAIPAVHRGVPVYDIWVATSEGKARHVRIDGNTGKSSET